MRLESLEIDKYKNLKNFKINFNQDSYMDLIIGKNGSGKSNFFEALIEIFSNLHKKKFTSFKYKMKYSIYDVTIEINNWDEKKILLNNVPITRTKLINSMPKNIMYYYAGLDNRIVKTFKAFERKHKRLSRRSNAVSLRKFLNLDHFYYKVMLLVMLIYNEREFRHFLQSFLDVVDFETIDIILKKPLILKKNEFLTDVGKFWGIEGDCKTFLEALDAASVSENETGLYPDRNKYNIRLKNNDQTRNLQQFGTARDFLNNVDLIFQYNMLENIIIRTPKNGELIFSELLSEGEKQIITVVGLLLLNGNSETIILLDEPDAFLHPKWQLNLCKEIIEHSGDSILNSHLLINSHCASTIVSSQDKEITLFEFENDHVEARQISKKDAVSRLTEGFISLSEDESKLRIDNVLRNSNKPVLFTEGITDRIILEFAWKSIYPQRDIPFLVQESFDRGFLRTLVRRDDIYNNYPRRQFFALFDFDEAYDDWVQTGELITTNPFEGLCRKRQNNNCHAFILPVVNNEEIKKQVIKRKIDDNNYETYENKAEMSIELLFYNFPQTRGCFTQEDCQGGGTLIKLNKDKVKFAEEIVPTLPREAFLIFKPIFDFVESKI